MGTLLFGIGIGVISTVGTVVAVASGCADRVVATFAADECEAPDLLEIDVVEGLR